MIEQELKGRYKRQCEHTDMVHWKTCPECREYMVTQDFQARLSSLRGEIEREKKNCGHDSSSHCYEEVCHVNESDGYNAGLDKALSCIDKLMETK